MNDIAMEFSGKVRFRSSKGSPGGAPGEAEIHELNPDREERICAETGWTRLEAGSLNLEVKPSVVDALEQAQPVFQERADQIVYPDDWADIPERREGYRYYAAIARSEAGEEPVLVRRAVKPLPRCVELFAQVSLKEELTLTEGDEVEVKLVKGVPSLPE